MTITGWLKSRLGTATKAVGRGVRRIRASYDSAQTTRNNRNHWQAADGLSANAAMSASVRKILRERSRYEVANNSYASGMIQTLADFTIGTCPRLQLLTDDEGFNKAAEDAFEAWAYEMRLGQKLRVMRMSRARDGEAFGIIQTNKRLNNEIKVDLRLIECDRVTEPDIVFDDPSNIDGIILDGFGNPVSYKVLKHHPGSDSFSSTSEYDLIQAQHMIHSFNQERPEQNRGTPEITPALNLYALLRRFTLATVEAAETAANIAGVTYSDLDPDEEKVDLDDIEIERNMLMALPSGWKFDQVRPEHPSSTYKEFKSEIINEIARCLNMPFNIAACNSNEYNYASGRLDHQTFFKFVRGEQHRAEREILYPLVSAWYSEFVLSAGVPKQGVAMPRHQWFWDGVEHVDPNKEATAQAKRLASGTTNLALECGKAGYDWRDIAEQKVIEEAFMADLRKKSGLTEEDAA